MAWQREVGSCFVGRCQSGTLWHWHWHKVTLISAFNPVSDCESCLCHWAPFVLINSSYMLYPRHSEFGADLGNFWHLGVCGCFVSCAKNPNVRLVLSGFKCCNCRTLLKLPWCAGTKCRDVCQLCFSRLFAASQAALRAPGTRRNTQVST